MKKILSIPYQGDLYEFVIAIPHVEVVEVRVSRGNCNAPFEHVDVDGLSSQLIKRFLEEVEDMRKEGKI